MLAWSPTLTVEVILIATLQMPPLPNSERGVLETKLPDGGPPWDTQAGFVDITISPLG